MKIILHGALRDQFEGFEIEADTVAEAIEGWSRQCGMAEIPAMDRPLLDVVGFDTIQSLTEKTQTEEIHIVPAMFGGGGWFGKVLIGVALIGLSFIPGIGQVAQMALLSAGIGMVLGGVMQLFMPSPSVSKSNDPDASKYLGSSVNSTEIGTLISKGYGRFLVGGQFLSIQVNSNDMVMGQFPSTVPA